MMKKIWKYEIDCDSINDDFHLIEVEAPRRARPLCFMAQHGKVFVWLEVETDETEKAGQRFCCVGTGHGRAPGQDFRYLGSAIVEPHVWHLYWQEGP